MATEKSVQMKQRKHDICMNWVHVSIYIGELDHLINVFQQKSLVLLLGTLSSFPYLHCYIPAFFASQMRNPTLSIALVYVGKKSIG